MLGNMTLNEISRTQRDRGGVVLLMRGPQNRRTRRAEGRERLPRAGEGPESYAG